MKTILYNKDTQQIKYHAKEGYYTITTSAKGTHRPEIPEPWVELEYVEPQRLIPTATQKLLVENGYADLENNIWYVRKYTVVEKTQYELDCEAFGYMEYERRLDIDGSVLFNQTGLAYRAYLEDRGYPVEMQPDGSYKVWINQIEPAHQPFIDQLKLSFLLTETLRPEIQ